MGLLKDISSRKKIDEEGVILARLFIKRLPLERAKNSKHFSEELKILLGHAQGYRRQSKLSFFGVSRLINSIQWTLIDAGYSPELAKTVSKELSFGLASDRKKAG